VAGHHAKADAVVFVARIVVAAVRATAVARGVVPMAATQRSAGRVANEPKQGFILFGRQQLLPPTEI
jgi:hypothetical protein